LKKIKNIEKGAKKMRRIFIFTAEIPYDKITILKMKVLSKRGYSTVCNGNKKVVRLKFLFREVKFNV